jgi:ferredoxin-NADP reductase
MHLLERPLRRVARSRVAAAATWPHGVDAFGSLLDPSWSADRVRAAVTGVRRQTPDTATVTLRPNANWRGHLAGQHVVLTVEVDGVRQARCFSVASSARRPGTIELTAKAGAASVVARHLGERLAIGDVVELSPAAGDFVLPEAPPRSIALLSAGSGITPVLSMLRTLADDGHRGEVRFVHHARTDGDILYGPEARALAEERAGWRHEVVVGDFEPDHLARAGVDPAGTVAFACGPPGYLDVVRAAWLDGGGSADDFHTESYGLPAPERTGAGTGQLRFGTTAVADDGRTLLVQAEAAGLAPAHGCRRGICRSCVVPLTAGTVVEEGGTVVTAGPGTAVRLCVTVADGDVEVAL